MTSTTVPQPYPRPAKRYRLVDLGRRLLSDPAGAVFLIGVAALGSAGVIGLPLAILGWFVPWLAMPLMAVAWAASAAVLLSLVDPDPAVPSTIAISAVALVIVAAFAVFASMHSSEQITSERDPGVYFVTGRWLADHGTLLYDTGLPTETELGLPEPTRSAAGLWPTPEGPAYFQFAHLMGVVLAAVQWVGGDALMLNAPALMASIALLGVFVLARRLTGPVGAAIALLMLVLHPAALHFAKSAYSEWLALAFAMAALWAWLSRAHSDPPMKYLMIGALIGATALSRVDAWLTVAAFFVGAAYTVATEPPNRETTHSSLVWMVVGASALGGIALADLALRSPFYLSHLWPEVRTLLIVVALASVCLVAAPLARSFVRGAIKPIARRLISSVAAAAVLLAGIFALFVRPRYPILSRNPSATIADLQEMSGVPVDPFRTYGESTLEWFAWYQGHLMIVLTIAAVALATSVFLRNDGDRRVPVLTVLMMPAVLYVWRPSITPDHMWAMRRFLPVVIPLGVVLLVWAIAHSSERAGRHRTFVQAAAGLSLAVGIFTMVQVGAPVAKIGTHIGVYRATSELCEALPDGAGVIVAQDRPLMHALPATIRSFCGVPTILGLTLGNARAVAAAGLIPIAVSALPLCQPGQVIGAWTTNFAFPEMSVERPPRRAGSGSLSMNLTVLDMTAWEEPC